MSDHKTPQPGEWWETRDRQRVIVGRHVAGGMLQVHACGHGFFINNRGECVLGGIPTESLARHLPACTGWDWEEPKHD